MRNLKTECVNAVAREIARSRVKENSGWQAWPSETKKAVPEAEEKINLMSNLELLDLLNDVFAEGD